MFKSAYKIYKLFPEKIQSGLRQILRAAGLWRLFELFYFRKVLDYTPRRQSRNGSDLTWQQFENQILKFRDSYKGVIVQERVIPWGATLYQRPQHMASALGKLGYLVIYQTLPFGADEAIRDVRQVSKNVWVTHLDEPSNIPFVIKSTYSGTPTYPVKKFSNQHIVYEYVDHIDAQIVGKDAVDKLNDKLRWALSGGADCIVASAQVLFDEVRAIHSNGHLIQNGVDFEHFQDELQKREQIDTMENFKKQFSHVIGYFGALAPWLWTELINDLIVKYPKVGFVIIGPDFDGGSTGLKRGPNVIYVGAVNHREIPSYARYFDFGIIPFRKGPIAKSTNPLKLFEYFAAGIPVIVTEDMAECLIYQDFVAKLDNADELEQIIKTFDAKRLEPYFIQQVLEIARSNSWQNRAKSFEEMIGNLL